MSRRTSNSKGYIYSPQSAQRICWNLTLKRRKQLRRGNAPTGSSMSRTPMLLWKSVSFGRKPIIKSTFAHLNGSESTSISTGWGSEASFWLVGQWSSGRQAESTHKAQMIKSKACFWSRIKESIVCTLRWRQSRSLAHNRLVVVSGRLGYICKEYTWWSVPGTSTVVNCARLYSCRAGKTPSCRESSSEIMFRTSVGQVWFCEITRPHCGDIDRPFRTSLISPGGDCRMKLEAACMRSIEFIVAKCVGRSLFGTGNGHWENRHSHLRYLLH
jgi:hypothetical protein